MEEWERILNELRSELILREQELDLLHEIDLRLLEAGTRPEQLFSFIVQRSRELLKADHVVILLRRSNFLEPMYATLKSAIGDRVPISDSVVGLCLEENVTIDVPDLLASPLQERYVPLRGYKGARMRSLLATPIYIRGTVAGVLNVESRRPHAFKAMHQRISAALAAQIAIALQRTQLLASTALFADVDRLMLSSDDTRTAIQTALEEVMAELQRLEHSRHSGAQIMFLRGDDELEIVHSTHLPDVGLILSVDESTAGRAVRERQTVLVNDVGADPHYQRILGDSIRSQIAVPILFGDDIVIGVLNVESEDEDAFHGFYQVVLESFAEKVRTLLAFAKLRSDVTEALELRNANELLIAVGDQASHMIHRLNNTVGAMRVRIMELQEWQGNNQPVDKEFLQESLRDLLVLAERTLKLPGETTRLLATGGTTVDINECVRQALLKLDAQPGTIISLSLDKAIPKLPLYNFDIVVQNLIQNALDATQERGEVAIATSLVRPAASSGYVQLVVSDSGIGIPADIQEKLFDLNFSTKHGRRKGLGLGLWWVRNFVRRARGDITVRSTPGAGTEMIVKIPLDRGITPEGKHSHADPAVR